MWIASRSVFVFLLGWSQAVAFSTPGLRRRTNSALPQTTIRPPCRRIAPSHAIGASRDRLVVTKLAGWFDSWGFSSRPVVGGAGKEKVGSEGGQPARKGEKGGASPGEKLWGALGDKMMEAYSSVLASAKVVPGKDGNFQAPWGGNVTLPLRETSIYVGGVLSGLALAVGVVFVPYTDVGTGMQKSLTLFENVLMDIDEGYVEAVDMDRLLQTAVVSMLRTLDPYTEFQNNQAAADLKESVAGRYGGVGLVITGGKRAPRGNAQDAKDAGSKGGKTAEPKSPSGVDKGQEGGGGWGSQGIDKPSREVGREGITVVSAFEGYAFDAGMRAGDRITAINGQSVEGLTVEKARDMLRGEPNSKVSISFIRDGHGGLNQNEQEITLTRRLVKLRDVKLATLVGDPAAPVGYLQLGGFSQGAGQELYMAYQYLDNMVPGGMKGVILDLRGNPGGLLDSAVDVAALFVPEGSDIVSVRGRNFQDVMYRSGQKPVRSTNVPLVVLTNGGTASAAEIVSGAVQDLDAGVIVGVGKGRTYGKGLVQNVAELPYNNALKYTVAKYYTPSGRCIQSVNYKEGGVVMGDRPESSVSGMDGSSEFSFEAEEVPELDRKEFVTKHGRVVFDGGGVEADLKVKLPKPSALEIALQVQGAYFDYAGQWTQANEFKGTNVVTERVLNDFKQYVFRRENEGTYHLAGIYQPQLDSLESVLGESNLGDAKGLVHPFSRKLTAQMLKAFGERREEIRSSLEEAILSRYLPESMVLRRQLDHDQQFLAALDLVKDKEMYRKIITPADAKVTEDVLRSFGQALKKSVEKGS